MVFTKPLVLEVMCIIKGYKESMNPELCVTAENFNKTTKNIEILYNIAMVGIFISAVIAATNYIYNFIKKQKNSKIAVLLTTIYFIFISNLLILIYSSFKEINNVVGNVSNISRVSVSQEYLNYVRHNTFAVSNDLKIVNEHNSYLLFFLITAIVLTSIYSIYEFQRGIFLFFILDYLKNVRHFSLYAAAPNENQDEEDSNKKRDDVESV